MTTHTHPSFSSRADAEAFIRGWIGLYADAYDVGSIFDATYVHNPATALFEPCVDVHTFTQLVALNDLDNEVNA